MSPVLEAVPFEIVGIGLRFDHPMMRLLEIIENATLLGIRHRLLARLEPETNLRPGVGTCRSNPSTDRPAVPPPAPIRATTCQCQPNQTASRSSAADRCGPALIELQNGRGERIRTSGPCVPNAMLYQAELHPVRAAEPRDEGRGRQGKGEERSSFLKKRTKKLLSALREREATDRLTWRFRRFVVGPCRRRGCSGASWCRRLARAWHAPGRDCRSPLR